MSEQVFIALLLTSLAGLSTTFGSAIALIIKRPTAQTLSLGFGFSAGVMIAVSFLEMLPSAVDSAGELKTYMVFFIGMFIIIGIETFLPHQYMNKESSSDDFDPKLLRTGKLTALGIAIHNFPEGLVTFVGTLVSIRVGFLLAIAIALHNIPEGISVSIPIFSATGDRRKAFMISFLSGMAEPVGALLGASFLFQFINEMVIGLTLALVAGIMIFLSLDELLPVAHEQGGSQAASIGMVLGMMFMTTTLIFLV